MRASEGVEIVLPGLRRAFATAERLADVRRGAAAWLPSGWSLNDTGAADGSGALLVACDEDLDGLGFLLSESAGALELYAVIEEELVLLGCRWVGGIYVPRAA